MAAVSVHQSTPGDDFELLVAKYNALAAMVNTLLAKLDADAGVTDVDYVATVGTADTVTLGY